jgi:2-(3-amino-3-carboxypropyl)histidine synthase
MIIHGYEIDDEELIETLKEKGWKTIILQLPEGLKNHANEFISFFENNIPHLTTIIAMDPCYGACDLPCISTLRSLGFDGIVHIGHTPIPSLLQTMDIPILFLNALSSKSVSVVLEKAVDLLLGKNIGIVTTAQHLHKIPEVKQYLEKKGFTIYIGKGDERIALKGQILGCNFSSALSIQSKVDCFLFIGSGYFHPLGLLLSTHKPLIVADPYSMVVQRSELEDIKDRVLRQRYGSIAQAKVSKTFGILIGLKVGQQRQELAIQLHDLIKKKGRRSFLFTIDHLSPVILESFMHIDCFVSTLCPRIAIDDHRAYKQTIITPLELKIALGIETWDTYVFDEIV